MKHYIEFDTKVHVVDMVMVVDLKQRLGRADCNIRPHEHDLYNSNIFVDLLNRHYRSIVGNWSRRLPTDELPEGAEVTILDLPKQKICTLRIPLKGMKGLNSLTK